MYIYKDYEIFKFLVILFYSINKFIYIVHLKLSIYLKIKLFKNYYLNIFEK